MKKLFTKIAIAVAGFTGVAVAQQDPQFTQFMYNKLIYNPGYAGTTGAICGVAQFRQQWVGFAGAPQSIAIAGDMRLKALPLGVGINIMTDKIGPVSTVFARFAGSYNITKIAGGTLGIGVDVGILQKKVNQDWITPEPLRNDPSIPTADGLNKTTFDIGLGAFYQIPGKFYAGISSTHLPAQAIKGDGDIKFQLSRHYYFMSGYTFQLNKWNKITPNVLVKSDVAATTFDANLTYMWSDMIWLGGTLRAKDAVGLMIGYQGKAGEGNSIGYKIGYSYDITLSKIKGYTSGTHEIILGVCYTPKVAKKTTYGNDRFLD